jgi:hypothetical protein
VETPLISKFKMADSKSDFICLKDVDTSFQNRSNSIFGRLGTLEASNENSGVETEDETARKEQRSVNKARNNSPRSASRRLPARVPQHVLSPEKWTKYSLENDGSDEFRGLNEHSLNKHAAHSFLSDLKKRKSVENSRENSPSSKRSKSESDNRASKTDNIKSHKTNTNEQTSNTSSKNLEVSSSIDNDDSNLLFKKPEPKIDTSSSKASAGGWKDGTYTMPEYFVGSARTKAGPRPGKRSGVKPVAGNGSVNLEHLGDECADGVATGEEEKMGKVKRNFRKRKMDDKRKDDDCENNTD